MSKSAHAALLQELAPHVLAAVMRRFRDFAAAEDAVQEALLAAAMQWPTQGVPANPRAWLITVASRRFTDHVRADVARRRRETTTVVDAAIEAGLDPHESEAIDPAADLDEASAGDDTLLLLFMCCHPALTDASAIALTLRAVAGLTTAEIAHAYLVPEATMAQRISRAKQSIKKSGEPFHLPDENQRAARLNTVLHVLYLIFNEGYASSSGPELVRADLAHEAIRLARAVHKLLPEHGEVAGLLALMLLTDARRLARCGAKGELIALAEQDRTLWDAAAIQEGTALVTQAFSRGAVGAYQIQAAIASLHDEAARANDTDWPQILALYSVLKRMSENPMITLNHAIAAAMVHGPQRGLDLLRPLDDDPRMAKHHRLAAVRGHFYEMAGQHEQAIAKYREAAQRTASLPERDYLLRQAAKLETN